MSITKEYDRIVISFKYGAKQDGELKILFIVAEHGEEENGVPLLEAKEELKERIEASVGDVTVTRHIKIPASTIATLNL